MKQAVMLSPGVAFGARILGGADMVTTCDSFSLKSYHEEYYM